MKKRDDPAPVPRPQRERKAGAFLKMSRREVTWIGWGLGILIALGIRRIR